MGGAKALPSFLAAVPGLYVFVTYPSLAPSEEIVGERRSRTTRGGAHVAGGESAGDLVRDSTFDREVLHSVVGARRIASAPFARAVVPVSRWPQAVAEPESRHTSCSPGNGRTKSYIHLDANPELAPLGLPLAALARGARLVRVARPALALAVLFAVGPVVLEGSCWSQTRPSCSRGNRAGNRRPRRTAWAGRCPGNAGARRRSRASPTSCTGYSDRRSWLRDRCWR